MDFLPLTSQNRLQVISFLAIEYFFNFNKFLAKFYYLQGANFGSSSFSFGDFTENRFQYIAEDVQGFDS